MFPVPVGAYCPRDYTRAAKPSAARRSPLLTANNRVSAREKRARCAASARWGLDHLPRCCIHCHAVLTLSRSERLVFHCSNCCARAESATRAGGSPGRRGTIFLGTFFPVTSSTAAITSFTDEPAPVPRFTVKEGFPACSLCSAFTCASARSTTFV